MGTRKLIVEVVGDSRSLERSFARSSAASKKFGSDMTRTSDQVAAGFARIGRLAAGGLIAGGATVALKNSVNAASDLAEQMSKVQQVFGSAADETVAWSRTTANSLGVSERAALTAAGTFGNLLNTVGLGPEKAAAMSRALVKLSADLASFNNASPQDTLDALRSGLVGEAEPLRRYGVLLSETRVQQEAMAETGKKSAASLTDQEKAVARYNLILKDTAPAQGDFARTSDGAANASRRLSANLEDLQANLASGMVPALAKVTGGLADMTAVMQTAQITADQLVNNKALRDKFADAFGVDELFKALNKIQSAGLATRPDEGTRGPSKGPKKADRVKFALETILGPIDEATRLANTEVAQTIKKAQAAIDRATADAAKTSKPSKHPVTAVSAAERAARAAAALQAAQFRALGLSPTGDQVTPTIANLSKQLEQLSSRTDLSAKAKGQLARIGKVLTDPVHKATEETRAAIKGLFEAIRGEFDKGADSISKGPHTPTTSLNVNRILKGLGLGPEAERQLRSRLSGFNSAGLALAKPGNIGAYGMTFNPSGAPIVVNLTTTLDGQVIARNTTRHQQKTSRSNPKQKRGSNAGI